MRLSSGCFLVKWDIGRDAFLVLHFRLHVVDGVPRLDCDRDGFAHDRLRGWRTRWRVDSFWMLQSERVRLSSSCLLTKWGTVAWQESLPRPASLSSCCRWHPKTQWCPMTRLRPWWLCPWLSGRTEDEMNSFWMLQSERVWPPRAACQQSEAPLLSTHW